MNAAEHPPLADPAPPAQLGRTATERVYQGIYSAVLERRLDPGAWLREEELAASFGVSRTVVRQALQRLAQDQVVELVHNRGARVPLLAREDAGHVFEARRVVECEIARSLGGRLSELQLQELRDLAAAETAADAAGDAAAAVRLSGEFHRAMARMHGNPLFLKLLDGLLPSTSVLMALFKVGGGPVCVQHRHVDLVAALGRSAAAAGHEMKKHLAELQSSLTTAQAVRAAPLRDLFGAYREQPSTVAPPAALRPHTPDPAPAQRAARQRRPQGTAGAAADTPARQKKRRAP
jgi:DNA-binding GntR family transcriptional regulator